MEAQIKQFYVIYVSISPKIQIKVIMNTCQVLYFQKFLPCPIQPIFVDCMYVVPCNTNLIAVISTMNLQT